MARVTWFVVGAAAGVGGALYGQHKAKEAARKLAPVNVARSGVGRARDRGRDVAAALREGKAAMRAKEAELRQRLGLDEPEPAVDVARLGPAGTAGYDSGTAEVVQLVDRVVPRAGGRTQRRVIVVEEWEEPRGRRRKGRRDAG